MDDLSFTISNRAYHHGQSDMTLAAHRNDQRVGYIDYSVYQGQPSIQMIKALQPGQGIGPAMVRRLQAEHPNIELDFGMLTPDGAKMLAKLPRQKIINADYSRLSQGLTRLHQQEKRFEALSNAFHANPTETGRVKLLAILDRWNDMHDKIWQLEQKLHDLKPYKLLIT